MERRAEPLPDLFGPVAPENNPRFPRWTSSEQDFWMDMFEHFSSDVLAFLPVDENSGGGVKTAPPPLLPLNGNPPAPADEARVMQAIELAGRMADTAVKEMLYRFHVNAREKRRRPKRTAAKVKGRR